MEGEENPKKNITKYYKGLFGPSKRKNWDTDKHRTEDIPQVTNEENEVREAIF
jgi:hypothetical protein